MDWPERLAAALDVTPLSPTETAAILDVARDVAHATERRYAPLSTFLLGVALAGEPGADREGALGDLAARVAGLLPDVPPDEA